MARYMPDTAGITPDEAGNSCEAGHGYLPDTTGKSVLVEVLVTHLKQMICFQSMTRPGRNSWRINKGDCYRITMKISRKQRSRWPGRLHINQARHRADHENQTTCAAHRCAVQLATAHSVSDPAKYFYILPSLRTRLRPIPARYVLVVFGSLGCICHPEHPLSRAPSRIPGCFRPS